MGSSNHAPTHSNGHLDQHERSCVRVFGVDDHPAVLEALSSVVSGQRDMEWCGEAQEAARALKCIGRLRPDVAIVDIVLKDAHGLSLVRHLREQYPEVRALVFSMYDEEVYAERAIRAGASGYLMKSEPMEEVAEAIRSVYRNEIHLSQSMAVHVLGKLLRGPAHRSASMEELTERERTVVQLLGEGCSVEEIKDRLGLARKTVEAYRRHAKEKLGLESVDELIRYAVQRKFERETSF